MYVYVLGLYELQLYIHICMYVCMYEQALRVLNSIQPLKISLKLKRKSNPAIKSEISQTHKRKGRIYVCEPSPDEDDEDDGIVKEVLESQRMYDTSDFEVCMYTCTYIAANKTTIQKMKMVDSYVCMYVCMYITRFPCGELAMTMEVEMKVYMYVCMYL